MQFYTCILYIYIYIYIERERERERESERERVVLICDSNNRLSTINVIWKKNVR